LIICVIVNSNCTESTAKIKQTKVFISEPLENQNNVVREHDERCLGFYKDHFDQVSLNKIFFGENPKEMLERETNIKWNIVSNDSLFDFNEYLSNMNNITPPKVYENRVIYLLEIIESDKEETRILSTGSDDGFILWVNGVKTITAHVGRACEANSEFNEIELRRGKNVLLYKIENGSEDWALYKKFVEKEIIEEVLEEKKNDFITDLMDSYILPDNSSFVKIKKTRINVDVNTFLFEFSWIDENNNEIKRSGSYKINNLPGKVYFPDSYKGIGRLRSTIRNKNNEVIYVETNPIFYDSTAKRLAGRITKSLKTNNPIYEARRHAVLDVFDIIPPSEDKQSYSTRIKANGLWDLCEAHKKLPEPITLDNGPSLMGYRSDLDNTIQLYRLHIPEGIPMDKKQALPILFSIDFIRYDYPTFLQGVGRSHFYMSYWQGMSTNFKTVIVTPYGRGEDHPPKDEIGAIYRQISKEINLRDSISLLGASTAAQKVIEILENEQLPISNVGLLGSSIKFTGEVLLEKINKISKKYPDVRFYIVHGDKDKDYSVENVRKIVKTLKLLEFEVEYIELHNANHNLDFRVWYKKYLAHINTMDTMS